MSDSAPVAARASNVTHNEPLETGTNGDQDTSPARSRDSDHGLMAQVDEGGERNSPVAYGSDGDRSGERTPQDAVDGSPPTSKRPRFPGSNSDAARSFSNDSPSARSSVLSRLGHVSRRASSRPVLRPFDKRLTSSLSTSTTAHLRSRSISSSGTSNRYSTQLANPEEVEQPWDVVRWTRLRKITDEIFSESGKRSYGNPTCITVSALIAIGTSKGLILVLDYHQDLKALLGVGTKATGCGAVTAIALSADHSTVAGGYRDGNIFTWEVSRPAKVFLHIPPQTLQPEQRDTHRQDGHVAEAAICHIEFLGTRHTALVSADNKGMAFSHLASRGFGAISRAVHTTRVLGRYPDLQAAQKITKRPSSVMAFGSVPLGNMESSLDDLGLVALLTPYLLVIVSTTPIAQTQHKAVRPRDLAPHGALSAALAWYPPMKWTGLKAEERTENAKLAYSWLNMINILEVTAAENSENSMEQGPPEFAFRVKKTWQAEESIVAIQWLSHSVLALVTITQQLLVLDISSMHVTDSSDLLQRQMYHTDIYSTHLSPLVDSLDDDDTPMHGVVADAFHMSFKAYKGRIFLLSYNDVSIGTMSNWADRLLALMEQGDFIAAITLATSYYNYDGEHAPLGLPNDKGVLQSLVEDRLVQMISASLQYTFSKDPRKPYIGLEQLHILATTCFRACLTINNQDLLFDDVYTQYSEGGEGDAFFRTLESYILDGVITVVPPAVLKDMVNHFMAKEQGDALEVLLCKLEPTTIDLDQVTTLCRRAELYDALLYIWSEAIRDYTTVLGMLLDVEYSSASEDESSQHRRIADKLFPYLSYVLTSRVYPTGNMMADQQATTAKSELYYFLFSNTGAGQANNDFVMLRQLHDLDPLSFFAMLNEAFEDPFLNDASGPVRVGASENVDDRKRFALSLDRQYILEILLQVFGDPDHKREDTVYLDMFIARSVAKFPQHLLLPESVLHRVLINLCSYHHDSLADDCQLSVEYLLSAYQPPDTLSLIPMLTEAQFYRVIKFIYRTENRFPQLLQASLPDETDPAYVFDCIRNYLGPQSMLNTQTKHEFENVIVKNAARLVSINLTSTAQTLDLYAPQLHTTVIEQLHRNEPAQFAYLRVLLDPPHKDSAYESRRPKLGTESVELYVRLLCEHNPSGVIKYINRAKTTDLRLDAVLPYIEDSGAVDAAVVLVARNGQLEQALERLLQHLGNLEAALSGLLKESNNTTDLDFAYEPFDDLLETLERFVGIGVWLCQRNIRLPATTSHERVDTSGSHDHVVLTPHEHLWAELVDAVVGFTRRINETISLTLVDHNASVEGGTLMQAPDDLAHEKTSARLKGIVHNTFTSLLTSTSTGDVVTNSPSAKVSFLAILRAFLSRASASSPSISHLRGVLETVFSAYTYQEELLALAHKLLDGDIYEQVQEVVNRRKQGWRPLGQTCGICGVKVWGPGVGMAAWNSWLGQSVGTIASELSNKDGLEGDGEARSPEVKGKSRVFESFTTDGTSIEVTARTDARPYELDDSRALIVFSCRHMFHRKCLALNSFDRTESPESADLGGATRIGGVYSCPLEPTN